MENKFAKIMSERTDEQLIKIVTVDRKSYESIAIEAAESEIEKRNINTTDFEKIKEKATIQKEQKQKVDTNVVSSGIRFVNFFVDTIVWLIVAFILFLLVGIIFEPADEILAILIGNLVFLGTYVAYHIIMENKFQKTVGKFLTKTKVVKENGEKPENSDIFKRTFCRLIPFDRLSFLFLKNGIHDSISRTKVVNDLVR